MRRLVAAIAVAAASMVLAAPAGAATPAAREFSDGITAASSPNGIAAGPDGNLWFTERSGDRIGRITPAGFITEFSAGITADAQPEAIAAGPDGNLWFTESSPAVKKIGRITPSGTIDEYSAGVGDSLVGITAGPDGNLWFTSGSMVGKMTPQGSPTVYSTGITASPGEIVTGADGNLWFTETDSDSNPPDNHKIARVDPAGTVTEYDIPDEPGGNPNGPLDITAGPDGKLWFTLGPDGIGRIDPDVMNPEATITQFTAGISGSPQGIVAGPDGNLWFTGSGPVGRITPSGTVTEFSAGITGDPSGIAAGPDGNLWFTEFFFQRIGRINTALDPMRYTDRARIEVPAASTTIGMADPYPATIVAAGLEGTVTEVSVRLNGVHHSFADDVEALLVGPQGQTTLLMADSFPSVDLTARDAATGPVITLDDDGVTSPGWLVSGIFEPILGPGAAATFPAPAPASPYGPNLSVFEGTNPNGAWKLFVQDDEPADTGAIAGGWSLDIQTTGPDPAQVVGPPAEVQVPGPATTVTGPGQTITVPGPTVPGPDDTTKAALKLTGPPARTSQAAFRKGLKVTVTPDEPVTLDVTLSVKPKGVTIARADDLVLFERTVSATGATAITVKPSARLLGKPRKSFRATLRIVAYDAAGNRTTVTRGIKVDPDRKTKRSKRR